jgi:hypothetical protein
MSAHNELMDLVDSLDNLFEEMEHHPLYSVSAPGWLQKELRNVRKRYDAVNKALEVTL